MIQDLHENFQHMIDESLAGGLSAKKEQSLREHLATCTPCMEYLSASNRAIAGLSGFSFEVSPSLNDTVLAAIRRKARQDTSAQPDRRRFLREHTVSVKVWAALGAALSMSAVGSALVYEVAERVLVPMRFDTAQVQTGVLVFWLLPSFCAAFFLLAAPGKKRGMA